MFRKEIETKKRMTWLDNLTETEMIINQIKSSHWPEKKLMAPTICKYFYKVEEEENKYYRSVFYGFRPFCTELVESDNKLDHCDMIAL